MYRLLKIYSCDRLVSTTNRISLSVVSGIARVLYKTVIHLFDRYAYKLISVVIDIISKSTQRSFFRFENIKTYSKKQQQREVLLHYFILKKNATDTYCLLLDVYGKHAPSNTTCKEWFRRFNNGDIDVSDKDREGAPKKI